MLRLRYFRIQLAITIIFSWCFSSHARHAENCKKRIAFDGWLQQVFFSGEKWRRRSAGKDCRKICLRFNGTACHSFKPVKWSDFTFFSIYFYIHEMMGKNADDSKEFCAPKWLIHFHEENRLGAGKVEGKGVMYWSLLIAEDNNWRLQGWWRCGKSSRKPFCQITSLLKWNPLHHSPALFTRCHK